ncbi:MAG: dihydroorotate dehydrogenase electron transfer subunit [Lachnospiraceae bacterium]|nr:dihydroorotate dehydrogenase electron transfer subunit [Lachnospiraceae bacterium]
MADKKIKERALVISQERLAEGIYSMWIRSSFAKDVKPGQFISIYTKDPSKLLPRPISVCQADAWKLRIVYRIAGEGTREFSDYKAGDELDILGPLGNGFPKKEGRAILIGGGIGVPPMVMLASTRKKEDTVIVSGYRSNDIFLEKELSERGELLIASEDGSVGVKGNVLDAIKEKDLKGDVIYACGPMPMLSAIKKYAVERGIEAYVSLEERMACGIGVCLGCVCETVKKDHHSNVNNTRICTEGPVFNALEVNI